MTPFARAPHPKRHRCPVSPQAHPLARRLFAIIDEEQVALCDVAGRAGLSHATLSKWKSRYAPTVVALEAALNAVGYELVIAKRKERFP